jgi:nucleoside-diphosphate-sugar epimerase
MSFWQGARVLVTGGASFIGSHLVDRLVTAGADVRVIDDFSSGRMENIERHVAERSIELIRADLRDTEVTRRALAGRDIVVHNAADHGGRGYVGLSKARDLLGWEPRVPFKDGLQRTVDWYLSNRSEDEIRQALATSLTER